MFFFFFFIHENKSNMGNVSKMPSKIQTQFQKSWDTVQIVNKKGMQ